MSLAKSDPRYVPPAVRAERKAQNDARFAEKLESIIEPFIREAREQGRREVLREIAELSGGCVENKVKGGWECIFCRAFLGNSTPDDPVPHKPSCLWLRAQAVKASE